MRRPRKTSAPCTECQSAPDASRASVASVLWHPNAQRRSRTSVGVIGVVECLSPSGGVTRRENLSPTVLTRIAISRPYVAHTRFRSAAIPRRIAYQVHTGIECVDGNVTHHQTACALMRTLNRCTTGRNPTIVRVERLRHPRGGAVHILASASATDNWGSAAGRAVAQIAFVTSAGNLPGGWSV